MNIDYSRLSEGQLRQIVTDSHSWNDVISKCGLKTITRSLQRKLQKYNIDCSHFETFFDGKYTKINQFSKEQIQDVVNNNSNWMAIMNVFGYKSCTNVPYIKTKLEKLNIDFSNVDPKYASACARIPLEEILVLNSTYGSMSRLKVRIQKELGWEHECSICKLREWNSKPIPLEIDHINGEHYDNRIDNLRFICPNCHAQTDTYKGKNMKVHKIRKSNEIIKAKQVVEPKKIIVPKCCDCEKAVSDKRSLRCKLCNEKHFIILRKVVRPSYEALQEDLSNMSMVKTGQKYGVSDNAVRKWLKVYERNNI